MNKIQAVIVDDELNARENLRYLLNAFCKEVEIVSEVANVDEATVAINKHKPQLVFLDIEMPRKNGFQLLDEFSEIDFQIIFITAYDMYAIKAFEVAAIDYLLKPIDIERLQEAVKKVKKSIKNTEFSKANLNVLKENKKALQKIAIPYKTDYVILDIDNVLCIEADRMYSVVYTKNNKKYMVAKKLSYYENLLCNKKDFVRLHRSWIVNINKIEVYSKKEKEVTLESDFKVPVSKSYKENFETLFYT
ncbi:MULTISPECIES: LytR/AlgR family response regulator transcription factor [Tenacibaculum]|uniref:LytR/AlgR family response regulator transcription factor n=1 Tax=Tenacibaculum TaxID=104267 RepID=UPI00089AB7D1|nr:MULTISPECIES: response regulator [unclassified Tenacibaculum]RBW61333.1 response regulator [Tenacibaculum sp. E3R01]SEE37087.1 two component transcriptional regulator, LytTR family [Tenacibaculum sp. MAR_2010_89]